MTEQSPTSTPANIEYQGNLMVDRNDEHIKILSICWYVVSGLAALGGLFPLIYVVLGLFIVTGSMSAGGGPGGPPPDFLGGFMIVFGSCFSLFIWTIAVLGFFTARNLKRRRRLILCYVTAALACLQIPVGTTLGVFTFIVLARPNVRDSFV